MKVVLGGSRKLGFIPYPVVSFLNDSIERGDNFFIGDAAGVDSTIQKFMVLRNYQNVQIFSSAGYVRNNLGNWLEHQIETNLKSKSNALHAFKDREMCKRADLGLMIWDQESAGTLSNAIDLLSQGKSCYIYNALDQEFVKFDASSSLDQWLETYPEVAAEALSRLNRFRNRMKIGSKLDSVQSELF
jgi:hypothetical protein